MRARALGLVVLLAGCSASAPAPDPRVEVVTLEASWAMLCGAVVMEYTVRNPDRVMVALAGDAIVVGAKRSEVDAAHQQCLEHSLRETTNWKIGGPNRPATSSATEALHPWQQNAFCAFEGKIWPPRADGCHTEDMPGR